MPTGSHFVSELLQWCCFPPRSSVQGWRFWHRWKWWPDFLSGASQTCRGPPSYPGKQNSKTSDQCIQQNIRSVHSAEHQISAFRRTSDQYIQENIRSVHSAELPVEMFKNLKAAENPKYILIQCAVFLVRKLFSLWSAFRLTTVSKAL